MSQRIEITDTQVSSWLDNVSRALSREGFRDTLLQVVKQGQVFGLVKHLDERMQMHVRGFEGGVLESEIEPSNEYFEHLNPEFCRDATPELVEILKRHRIPYTVTGNLQKVVRIKEPETLTPWMPFAVVGGVIGFLVMIGYVSRKRSASGG